MAADTTVEHPRPGPIGRVVRVLFGLGLVCVFVAHLLRFTLGEGPSPWDFGLWLTIAPTLWWLHLTVDRGFGIKLGRRAQLIALACAAITLVVDGITTGNPLGPATGVLILVYLTYVLGHLSISLLLGGALAVPG